MAHGKCRTVSATLNETVSLLSCRTLLHCKRETLVARKDTTEACTEQELCNDSFQAINLLKRFIWNKLNTWVDTVLCCQLAAWAMRVDWWKQIAVVEETHSNFVWEVLLTLLPQSPAAWHTVQPCWNSSRVLAFPISWNTTAFSHLCYQWGLWTQTETLPLLWEVMCICLILFCPGAKCKLGAFSRSSSNVAGALHLKL